MVQKLTQKEWETALGRASAEQRKTLETALNNGRIAIGETSFFAGRNKDATTKPSIKTNTANNKALEQKQLSGTTSNMGASKSSPPVAEAPKKFVFGAGTQASDNNYRDERNQKIADTMAGATDKFNEVAVAEWIRKQAPSSSQADIQNTVNDIKQRFEAIKQGSGEVSSEKVDKKINEKQPKEPAFGIGTKASDKAYRDERNQKIADAIAGATDKFNEVAVTEWVRKQAPNSSLADIQNTVNDIKQRFEAIKQGNSVVGDENLNEKVDGDIDEKSDEDWMDKMSKLFDDESSLTSDVGAVRAGMEFLEDQNKLNNELVKMFQEQSLNVVETIRKSNEQMAAQIQQTTSERLQNVNDSFARIEDQIARLAATTNDLYDRNVDIQAQNLAKSLADKGLITSAQASQGAKFAVAAYRRNAELKKAEIEKDIRQQMISVIQEKNQAVDAIKQQEAMDATAIQQATSSVETMYDGILQNYMGHLSGLRQTFMQNMNALNQANIELDLLEAQDMVQERLKTITPERWNRMEQQPLVKYSWGLDIAQQLGFSPELSTYLARYQEEIIQADRDNYVRVLLNAINKSKNDYIADQRSF